MKFRGNPPTYLMCLPQMPGMKTAPPLGSDAAFSSRRTNQKPTLNVTLIVRGAPIWTNGGEP